MATCREWNPGPGMDARRFCVKPLADRPPISRPEEAAMNLQCPHCGEPFPYRHEQAGQPQACPSCKKPVQVPPFDKLPKALQEEYQKDLEWERKDAEAKQHKQEVRQQKEAARAAQQQQEAARAIQQQQRAAEERRQQAAWDVMVQASQETTPEEAALSNRYPALGAIALLIKVVVVLAWIVWLVQFVLTTGSLNQARDSGGVATGMAVGFQFLTLIPLVIGSISFWAMAEIIRLLIDVANDLRVNRFLLKGIRYQQQGEKAKHTPHFVAGPACPPI